MTPEIYEMNKQILTSPWSSKEAKHLAIIDMWENHYQPLADEWFRNETKDIEKSFDLISNHVMNGVREIKPSDFDPDLDVLDLYPQSSFGS